MCVCVVLVTLLIHMQIDSYISAASDYILRVLLVCDGISRRRETEISHEQANRSGTEIGKQNPFLE